MGRKLCSIQTIASLAPIEGKDRIVLASFENIGFKTIVDKSFSVGEKVVYCEVDSLLPPKPEFENLRARCWNEKWQGHRIKAMKMGNGVSEGICFKLDILGEHCRNHAEDGLDVTECLNIRKYDPELQEEQSLISKKKYGKIMQMLFRVPFLKKILLPKKQKGGWPSFMSKTDETRVQVLPYVFEKYKGMTFYVTEKMDGQSASFGIYNKDFYVCSRNMRLFKGQEGSKYWETAKKFDIEAKLREYKKFTKHDIYIQGEQIGPGIQGNKLGFKELKFFVFNVYDITEKRYFGYKDLMDFCMNHDLPMVQLVDLKQFSWNSVEELVEYAKGNSKFADVPREGIVLRPTTPMPDEGESNTCSFKVINPDFQIKYNL
jgi:hypothetical protein